MARLELGIQGATGTALREIAQLGIHERRGEGRPLVYKRRMNVIKNFAKGAVESLKLEKGSVESTHKVPTSLYRTFASVGSHPNAEL